MSKTITLSIALIICLLMLSSCGASSDSNKTNTTAKTVKNEITTSDECSAGPFVFDGEDYYHNVFDYYKKQLKVFSGKDKFNKKYEFDFSDTTFFCGSPCYNNEMYYVFSDVDTKVTDVYHC